MTGPINRDAILRRRPIDSLLNSGAVEPTERQMTTVTVRTVDLAEDLARRLDHLASAYREVFNPPGSNGGLLDGLTAGTAIEHWLEDLLLANDGTAAEAARQIRRALISDAEAQTPYLWETPLGRVLASRGAYPDASMPRVIAQGILGVTKQRISQMVLEGLLVEGGQGVTAASVVRLLSVASNVDSARL